MAEPNLNNDLSDANTFFFPTLGFSENYFKKKEKTALKLKMSLKDHEILYTFQPEALHFKMFHSNSLIIFDQQIKLLNISVGCKYIMLFAKLLTRIHENNGKPNPNNSSFFFLFPRLEARDYFKFCVLGK